MSLYEILEIKSNASESEIKKAYHILSKKYHPDKCKDKDATEKFQQISSAYQILMDDKVRDKYQKMNFNEKNNFVIVLEKLFKNDLKIEELKILGLNLSKKDWEYLQSNFFRHCFYKYSFSSGSSFSSCSSLYSFSNSSTSPFIELIFLHFLRIRYCSP